MSVPEDPGQETGAGPPSESLSRLDPDRAGPSDPTEPTPPPRSAVEEAVRPGRAPSDTTDVARRYRWIIGIFGLTLVVAVSVFQFATHGIGTTGVTAGQRLHYFAAPLANTTLVGDPNLHPPCTETGHDPRALNVCLDVQRRPLVLSFFVGGASECRRSVDALQALSRQFSPSQVSFAAVAIHGSRSATAALIRSHHWTIPAAYDRDGSVGGLYGVAICPMLELARPGGIVSARLIGDRYQTAAAIAPAVRALVRGTS